MAGDWIKMRVDLGDDPAVIGIASELDMPEDLVVGKLHRLWSWADKHTTDGTTTGVTLKWVDRFVAAQGFADALCKFHWLGIDGNKLIFPNFDRHNGASAKSRSEATIRQRLSRKNRDDGVTGVARVVTPAPFVRFVIDRDESRCVYCGWIPSGKEKLSLDHLIPLTRGGKDALENLVSCCPSCNNEKNDRTPEEFGLLPTFLSTGVTYVSQQICDNRVTKALPREEKRREESNTSCASPDGDCTDEAKNPLYTKAFLMFWEIYPLRKNKGDASKAFSKIKAAEYPAIKAGLVAAKESAGWLKDNGQFIPHPGTWLRARGWEDEPVTTATKPDGKLDVVAWMNSKEARNG